MSAVYNLQSYEKLNQDNFTGPVDPNFASEWRDYEARYASVLNDVWFGQYFEFLDKNSSMNKNWLDNDWDNADFEANQLSINIETAFEYTQQQLENDRHIDIDPDGEYRIQDGIDSWEKLKRSTRFNFQNIMRKRSLIPFVLMTREVTSKYGNTKKLSMIRNLQEAQDAFIFGANYASIAMMRSIVESVIRDHYKIDGKNLKERIQNLIEKFPNEQYLVSLDRLRKLANSILHLDNDEGISLLPDAEKELEKEILRHLIVIRRLIENLK